YVLCSLDTCPDAGFIGALKYCSERSVCMWHPVVLMLASLLIGESVHEIAAKPFSPPVAAGEHCEQSMAESEQVLIGPYPLHVIVTNIDYEKGAIDFATEVGTFLHVIHASAHELQWLKVGDKVELCIAEELHGDLQT